MLIRRATANDAAGIAKVHVDCWRATYRGMIAQDVLDRLSYETSENRMRAHFARSDLFGFVAEDADRIVGFAFGGPETGGDVPLRGTLSALYVLPEHQRLGIGRELMAAVARELAARDFRSMLVWVLAQNPARRFYEGMGGRCLGQKTVTLGNAPVEEAAYVWDDIGLLTGDHSGESFG